MIKWKGITVDEKLEKFLKDNNAYEAFCENVDNDDSWDDEDKGVLNSIDGAFIWVLSKQGCDYWSDLHDKFDVL